MTRMLKKEVKSSLEKLSLTELRTAIMDVVSQLKKLGYPTHLSSLYSGSASFRRDTVINELALESGHIGTDGIEIDSSKIRDGIIKNYDGLESINLLETLRYQHNLGISDYNTGLQPFPVEGSEKYIEIHKLINTLSSFLKELRKRMNDEVKLREAIKAFESNPQKMLMNIVETLEYKLTEKDDPDQEKARSIVWNINYWREQLQELYVYGVMLTPEEVAYLSEICPKIFEANIFGRYDEVFDFSQQLVNHFKSENQDPTR